MTSGRAGRATLRHADSHAIYRTHDACKKKTGECQSRGIDGGPSGVRTLDLGIKSPLLCQLS